MSPWKRSKVLRTFLGTALFGALAFGLAACPEEEPIVDDDPIINDEPPADDPFDNDLEDDNLDDTDDDV